MSYLLPHLTSGWAVDQAILSEEARVVCLRFGHDYDPVCMQATPRRHQTPPDPQKKARALPHAGVGGRGVASASVERQCESRHTRTHARTHTHTHTHRQHPSS